MKNKLLNIIPLWICSLTMAVAADSNVIVRIMAANLTTGNYQRYETPGLNILKGLRPDIVAIQEFNYDGSLRAMIDATFGTNFGYFCETGYSIPNGIISRYPILAAGSWEDSDTGVNDRGFAWAQIDVPGTNDLYVVSVHLKASSGSASRRAAQVAEITSLIAANVPPKPILHPSAVPSFNGPVHFACCVVAWFVAIQRAKAKTVTPGETTVIAGQVPGSSHRDEDHPGLDIP